MTKVCKTRSQKGLGPGEGRIEYFNGKGELLGSWKTGLVLGETRDFEVYEESAAGRIPALLFVASRKSESNGIAIQDWDVVQLEASTMQFSEVATVQDFGEGSLARTARTSECFLLKTLFVPGEKGNFWSAHLQGVDASSKWIRVPALREISKRYTVDFESFRLHTRQTSSALAYGRYSTLSWFQVHSRL